MFTSPLSLLGLQVSLGTGLTIIGTPPNASRLSQIVPNVAPNPHGSRPSVHPFNATLGEPPDPFDVPWALNRYRTTFHSYSEPSLPYASLRAFIDRAISPLNNLKQANHSELDDPIPGGMFQYESETFSPLVISFFLARDPPGAAALTYYETGGVIASLGPYIRKWRSTLPASAALELWKEEGAMSEQKAAGYIVGFSRTADQ